MLHRSLPVPIVAATLILVQPALAQQGAGVDQSEAAKAFAKGTELLNQHKYIGAIEAYQLAYRIRPHFFVQCSIARCYQNLNDMVKAAEHYQRCLDEGASKKPMAARVSASLKAVSAQITWMMVRSPGKGGTIYVDGREAGQAPRKVAINPGSHVIEVRRTGAKPATSRVKTLGGEERELTLVPLELDMASGPGGGDKQPTPSPREPPSTSRAGLSPLWFWSGVGLTGALAIVTTVLGVQTLGLRSDYNEDPTEQGADDFDQRRMLTNVFLGLTAAAAAGSTLLFFYTDFGSKRETDAGDTEALRVGVGLRGTF
jgi:hypothetical protein